MIIVFLEIVSVMWCDGKISRDGNGRNHEPKHLWTHPLLKYGWWLDHQKKKKKRCGSFEDEPYFSMLNIWSGWINGPSNCNRWFHKVQFILGSIGFILIVIAQVFDRIQLQTHCGICLLEVVADKVDRIGSFCAIPLLSVRLLIWFQSAANLGEET